VLDHVFSSLFYSLPILTSLSYVKHHKVICFNSVISLVAIPLSNPLINLGPSYIVDLSVTWAITWNL
jgi:hypothetical protein